MLYLTILEVIVLNDDKMKMIPSVGLHLSILSNFFKWKDAHKIETNAFCSFSGLPFIPYLDNLPNFNRSVDGPIRLPIVDKYKVQIKIII